MKKYMETVIPIVCDLNKAFKDGEISGREYLNENRIGTVDCGGITEGIEIPLEILIENGFTIRAYLKDVDKENPTIVDKGKSGVIILSIQNQVQEKSYMQDAMSLKLDERSELEISTLITNIINYEKPGALGSFDLEKFHSVTKENIQKIFKKEEFIKEQRNKAIEEYVKNPEKARKETKKALENIKHKQKLLKEKKDKTSGDIKKFQDELLMLVNKICTINGGISSIEEIKLIPEIAEEIKNGTDIAKVIDVLSKMAEFGQASEIENKQALEVIDPEGAKLEKIEKELKQ